jgi:RNA polymerase primary sigma factor
MHDSGSRYLEEIEQAPRMTQEEFLRELRCYRRTGRAQHRNAIIRSHMRLVVSIARRYYRSHNGEIELQDLIEEGFLGLIVAVDKYKPGKKSRFPNYAASWIQNKINKYIKEKRPSIEVPAHMMDLMHKWLNAWQTLYRRAGSPPSLKDIARHLHITPRSAGRILELLQTCTRIASLDSTIDPEGEISIGDTVKDPSEVSPEDFISALSDKQIMKDALERLTRREAMVIRLRYGLGENRSKKLSYRKVATILHLSPERISQLDKRAVMKMKRYVAARLVG